MDKLLYSLPLGESMRSEFITEAEQYPYGQALYVVPGRFIGEEVKRSGKVRTAIMDFLPNEILRLNNYAGDFVRISRNGQEMLVQSIMEELVEKKQITYFADLVGKKGFSKNVVALLGELARGSVDAQEFTLALSTWGREGELGAKDRELSLIYSIYTERLRQGGYYDIDGLYRLALLVLAKEPVLPWKKIYFSEFYQFDSLELALIKALSVHCHIAIGLYYEDNAAGLKESTRIAYEDLLALGFEVKKKEQMVRAEQGLSRLRSVWKKESTKLQGNNITFLRAQSCEQEMSMVVIKIKQLILAGSQPEDIICLVRNLDDYSGLSHMFKRYGVPTTLPEVTGYGGQLFPGFFKLLLALAQSPQIITLWQQLLAYPLTQELYQVPSEELEESYNEYCFTTVKSLHRFLKEQGSGANLIEDVKKLSDKRTAVQWQNFFQELFAQWSLLTKWGSSYQEGKIALEQLKILAQSLERTEKVLENFVLAMQQSGQGSQLLDIATVAAFFKEQSVKEILTLKSGNKRGVKVMSVTEVQGMEFPHVFILGLREGVFPHLKQESWLYNDQERVEMYAAAGIPWKLTAVAAHQEEYFFASALAMAQASLTLSCYVDDSAGPSAYWQELKGYFLPEEIREESWIENIANCYGKESLLGLLAQEKNLEEADEAWLKKEEGASFRERADIDVKRWQGHSCYNGYITGMEKIHNFSASALDDYLNCPFAYLGQRVWHIKEWQPLTTEVTPLTRGNLFHLTLAKFLERYVGKNISTIALDALQEQLEEDFQEIYGLLLKQGQIFSSPLAPYEEKAFLKALKQWLEIERVYQGNQAINLLPFKLEQAFGRIEDPSSWPALTLKVEGEQYSFTGQIDRIDSDGLHYTLTDYKTGLVPNGAKLRSGQALQLPLYVLALAKLGNVSPENILGAGYYSFLNRSREGGAWEPDVKKALPWVKNPPALSEVMEVAQDSIKKCVQSINQGDFPVAPYEVCPSYCPMKNACRYHKNMTNGQEEEENG